MTAQVQAVVVLYKCKPEDSPSLQGLLQAMRQDREAAEAISLLVYDNSPDAHEWTESEYVHDTSNRGVVAAYSAALARAQASGAEWLLLLDQDTHVTPEFVRQQLQIARDGGAAAAVVPRLRSGGKVRSPHRPPGWRQMAVGEDFSGIAPAGTTAFNSGALLRRVVVEAVGGFPPNYPLDFSDHAMFSRVARGGHRVWVLPVTLEHEMNWEDPARRMSIERFSSVLEAERRFHREYGDWRGILAFRLRCLRRAWRYRDWGDKRYAKVCRRVALGG